MNKAMQMGLIERWIYTFVLGAAMQGVAKGWWDADMATYIAVGVMGLGSSARGWWVNRPQRLLDDAAATLPKNSKLDMVPAANATHEEKTAIRDLAASTDTKVTATKLAPA
jgi:hypothetical protein